ncbi:MAG TPA: hypothetical protein PLT86_09220 [Candidatus Latescibacteria bacterium]|nr:hypothetical protein [Candidatus Latescibacterota bacterium]
MPSSEILFPRSVRVPSTRRRFPLFPALVAVLLVAASAVPAALQNYRDPTGYTYPTTWPSVLATSAYTRLGVPEADKTGQTDGSKGASPQGANDFTSGPLYDQPSFYYYGNGTILYFRFRVGGPPTALTGSGQPFTSATWNVLMDIDGDGWKEFVVFLDGTSSGNQPDDIVIIYENVNSQKFDMNQVGVWRQDCAGPSDGVDGASGSSSTWDTDPDAYVWDFGRTRVVQIDRTKPVGSQKSEYWIDVQVPLEAFDGRANGGPLLTGSSFFSISATTSASNSDPTQKDLLYSGDFALADVPLPGGDIYNGYGGRIDAPIIAELTQTGCPSPDTLKARVSDVLTVVGGLTTDTIDSVWFEYYYDYNGDWGENDPGQTWTRIGAGTRTGIGQFRYVWDVSQMSAGNFLIRAVARDKQGNTTYSTSNPAGTAYLIAKFTNTCSAIAVLNTSTKSVSDLNGGLTLPADTLLYTIVIQNTGGGTATSVVLKDTVSTYLNYVPNSATPTPAATNPALQWNVGTLAAGASATFTFRGVVKSPIANQTEILNKGWITYNTGAMTGLSKLVTATITVTSQPIATCSKTVDKATAAPGDTLVYTVTYGNNGTDAATFLIISDTVPFETDYVPNSVVLNGVPKTDAADADQVTVSGNNVSVTVGTLPVGGSGTFSFRVKVK